MSTKSGIHPYGGSFAYEGELKNGFMHGKGRLIYSDGRVSDGLWKNDIFIEEGGK